MPWQKRAVQMSEVNLSDAVAEAGDLLGSHYRHSGYDPHSSIALFRTIDTHKNGFR